MTDQAFKPVYTWPNDSFPFRVYYDSDSLRIFLIENIFHNYKWMKAYARNIQNKDIFLVILGWHHSDWHAKHSKQCLSDCGIDQSRFVILCNDYSDLAIFSDYGFRCELVNQNCFLDWNLFKPGLASVKVYDAIYVARLTEFKRHYLAADVQNLALVTGDLHGAKSSDFVPRHTYINSSHLGPDEVGRLICESHCGLVLSEVEGACFASSEYLLTGIPVVSTNSKGGRSIWYNDYNSKIVDAEPGAVAKAVQVLKDCSPEPERIRKQHIILSKIFRQNFVRLLDSIFVEHKVVESSLLYFERHYYHKMRKSENPNFDSLFPP